MRADRVLVAVDTDGEIERALPAATGLARALGAPVELVTVVPVADDVPDAEATLHQLAERARRGGATVSVAVEVDDDPVRALLAEIGPGDLVVMATSSTVYAHDHYVGSVAETLAREAEQPIVLVGPACDVDSPLDLDRVVMAYDESERARAAIPLAASWARFLRATLWLVTVTSPATTDPAERAHLFGALQRIGHQLRSCSLDVEWDVVEADDVAGAILDRAGPKALAVVVTRGRKGLDRIAKGSVASDLTRLAPRPVVVVGSP